MKIHEELDVFAVMNTERSVGEANYGDGIIVAIDAICNGGDSRVLKKFRSYFLEKLKKNVKIY